MSWCSLRALLQFRMCVNACFVLQSYSEANDLLQSPTGRCNAQHFRGGSSPCVNLSSNGSNIIDTACLLQECGTRSGLFLVFKSKKPVRVKIAVDQIRRSIGVGGSYTLTVNLSLLRKSGLIFNQFSVVATTTTHASCFARSLADGVRFKIKFDDRLEWSRMFSVSGLKRSTFHVPSTVRSISLIVKRLKAGGNPIRDCFVGEWLEPTLSQRMPLVSSCYGHCLSSSTVSGSLHLRCLLPFCFGDCDNNTTYKRVDGVRDWNGVCGHCNSNSCPSIWASGSILSTTNETVTLHIDVLRNYGYDVSVFRTGLALERSDANVCPSTVDFLVLLDGNVVRRKTARFDGHDLDTTLNGTTARNGSVTEVLLERDLVVVVSDVDKLKLAIETTKLRDTKCRMKVKWHNPRLSRSLASPKFVSCNETCLNELSDGRLYLGCFMGVCDRTVARNSYQPFFTLNYHHDGSFGDGFGIGANTVGSWMDESSDIRLTDRNGKVQSFRYAIGAYPHSSITFHLNAFRSRGYKFNFFLSTLGINSHSGCNSTDRASVIFRVYADRALAISKAIHDMRTSETILYDVRDVDRLTLVTRVAFPNTCRHAVWAGAELVTGQFSRRVSKSKSRETE